MAADIGGIGSDDDEGMPIIPDLENIQISYTHLLTTH